MNNYMRHTKSITFEGIKSLLALILIVLASTLSACSQEPGQNEASVSGDTLTAPLPSALLTVDETNLVVAVVVDGGAPQTCTNLSVDQVNGTYSCNITLSGGPHTISLVFSIIDATYGTVQVATASGLDVDVVPGQTVSADFSTVPLTYDDSDGDGISNLDELDEGSDPNTSSYYVGGTVSGLSGSGLVIQLNGGNDLPLSSDGSFNFIPAVDDNSSYTVSVLTQPSVPDQTCTVSNGSGTVNGANITDVTVTCDDTISFDPAVAPQNVQVVSGDGNTSEVQNTISWTEVPAATGYVVYVENTPGVTESSSVVVPAATGINYITHSGVGDVVAGDSKYYRVQAVSGEQSSILSAEVTGTPQESITSNALNDVAWDGSGTLVAVGDSGAILNSANGMADEWSPAVNPDTLNNSLAGVTWESVNHQFLIVGAGGTVLTGDGTNWNLQAPPLVAADLEDVTWLGDGYIAVGKSGTIITSDNTGSIWTQQVLDPSLDTVTLEGVTSNGTIIVAVGTGGTMLTSSNRGVDWLEVQNGVNNDLNDITWDGNQFGVVGSNDTILTSPDGVTWTSHIPGTPGITFVAASQWDSSLPVNPVLGAVGSVGTFVVSPDSVTGLSIPTGTNQQLSGMTWVDDGVNSPYFVIVGNDGTVLTSQLQ